MLRLSGGDEAVGQAVGGVAGTVLFNVALTDATDGAYLTAQAVLPGLVTLVTATRDATKKVRVRSKACHLYAQHDLSAQKAVN